MTILRHTPALIGAVMFATLATRTISAQEGEYGTIPSRFQVTQLGEASYSLAIDLPEGPGGIRPNLSLEYRHRSGDGPLGMGWRIGGLSAITRCPQTVAQDGQAREVRYDSADKYCLDGQRLVVTSGTYGAANSEYRTEIESFKKIVAYGQVGAGPAYFIVTDRNGTQYSYGHHYGSSIADVATGSYRQWALHYIHNTSNSDIEILWTTGAAGELLVDKVNYTRNDPQGMTPAYRAAFIYEDKPIVHRRTGSHWGAPAASTKRLKQISVEHSNGSWQSVRRYDLRYVPESDAPHHSLLESVQQCGTTLCLNGHWFKWADGQINASGFGTPTLSNAAASTSQIYVGDFNGDGKEDVASQYYVNSGTQWTDYKLAIYYSNGTAFAAADVQHFNYCSEYRVIELNGDGRTDLLCIDGWYGPTVPADFYFYESTASGWVSRGGWSAGAAWDSSASRYRVLTGDVNGDGLTDLMFGDLAGGWWIRLGMGGGNFTAATSVGADANSQPYSVTLGTFTNMDDDQALELVVPWLEPGGYTQGAAVFQHNPTTGALDRYITQTDLNVPSKAFGVPNALKPLPDINGDGLPDLVYEKQGGANIYTKLNTGNGFDAEQMSNIPSATLNFGRYVDVNNDGRDDVLLPTGAYGLWQTHLSNGTTFTLGSVDEFPGAAALFFC